MATEVIHQNTKQNIFVLDGYTPQIIQTKRKLNNRDSFVRSTMALRLLRFAPLIVAGALLGAGIQHGQFHLYNSVVPHVHANGVIHSH